MREKKISYELEDFYAVNFQVALSLALTFFILLFLTLRTLGVTPYRPKGELVTQVEALPQELEQLEEPPPPAKPQLPVESEEVEEEVEFTPTTEFNELEPPPPTAEAYEFYAVEIKPELVRSVEPEYPEVARRAGIEGQVFIKVLVNEVGDIINVQIVKSSNPIFDEPTKMAAYQFKFKPGYQRDQPVKVWVAVPFRFKLTK